MKISTTLVVRWFFLGSLVFCGFSFAPVRVVAQKGDKAVWTLSGQNPTLAASSAWVDASVFCGSGGTNNCGSADFCSMVSQAITQLLAVSPAGGVVDARGVLQIPAQQGGSMACNNNNGSPFPSSITLQNPPNAIPITILLPPYTIALSATWIVPNNVRLVGVGFETNLLGGPNCSQDTGICSGYMIEMGPPSPPQGQSCPFYTGIVIEHVRLTTQGGYGGIDNECAGSASYVNDVKISAPDGENLGGNGLTIGSGATNSGPYTDIYVQAAPGPNNCGVGAPTLNCVAVNAQTRGIHGVTCQGNNTTGGNGAGILVNASDNSIEDVHVELFYDGIGLGNTNSSAVGNIFVSNINAYESGTCGGVTNAVHVYGSVTDAVIIGVSNGPSQPLVSIQDDETETTIQGCPNSGCPNPITSGIYVLGRSDGGNTGEYSRFTTSPANKALYGNSSTIVPTWGTGSPAAGIQGTMCYTPGAIYSFTTASGNDSLYVCTFVSGTTWQAFP
jgi:hypothetical protein